MIEIDLEVAKRDIVRLRKKVQIQGKLLTAEIEATRLFFKEAIARIISTLPEEIVVDMRAELLECTSIDEHSERIFNELLSDEERELLAEARKEQQET